MARWSRQIFVNPDAALRKEVTRLVREERPRPRKIPAGSVVEFIRDNRLSCGVVWPNPANGVRYLILDQRGHQSWMLRKRFQHVSNVTIATSRRQYAVNELYRVDERREAEVRELDMATLWEVVSAASGTRGWTLAELAGLLLGDDRLESSDAALLRALWSRNWFERKGVLWHALDSAVISRRQHAANDVRKREQELDQLAAWVLAKVAGRKSAAQSVNRDRAISLLREVALTAKDELDPNSDAAQLMSRAHLHGSRAAFDLLVGLGHWSAQEDLRLHRRDIPMKFDDATLADAVSITDPEISWLPQARHCRRWWRRPWGFTVSGEEDTCSRSFSVRRTCRLETRLTIFVAVPALLVNEGGRVDSEARLRGTSLTLPDRHIGLFPSEIGAATGFVDGEWKPAIAVDISLSDDLEPRSVHLSLRRVRCHVIDAPTDPPGGSPWPASLAALSA
jgi:exoribonuclease-2